MGRPAKQQDVGPAPAEKIKLWREHPVAFVSDVFGIKPDPWQAEGLECFPHTPRLALAACKGPGKTALLAWLGWNFLLTRPHPMIGATSISGANLKANLWTELARWHGKSTLLQAMFEQTKSEVFLREHPKTWKLEARTWPVDADGTQIGNALAGVHAAHVMWLLDESGSYPTAIMPTCEGIFAGAPEEAHIVQAGNPTSLEGPLYRACTIARDVWRVIHITADPDDPKRTPRVSVEHAREQIRQYGADNPWVLVNIFGKFPPGSLNALIGPDAVEAAMKRLKRPEDIAASPRILGVDVARYGDDQSVIFPRQGVQAFLPKAFRNADSLQGAGAVATTWRDWDADACFIDNTGGFGAGWIDQLGNLKRTPIGVGFSEKSSDLKYFNKRAEMYFLAVEWIKNGGALPECPELLAALTQTTYMFKGDKLLLEDKDMVKAKIGYSPDHADAFVLTFAHPVAPRVRGLGVAQQLNQVEYDPFQSVRAATPSQSTRVHYDPYAGT